jgi:hypothetical protein
MATQFAVNLLISSSLVLKLLFTAVNTILQGILYRGKHIVNLLIIIK